MKKIFSVFVGLLLLGSVFGIASVMAPPEKIQCYAKAGDTLTLIISYDSAECQTFEITNKGTSEMMLILGPICHDETTYKMTEYTYIIRNAGTLNIYIDGDYTGIDCNIFPKPHPMKKFMEILGLGKEK